MTEIPELLTVEQVAEHLNVTAKQVYKWIRDGEMDAIKLSPRNTRVSQGQLQSFLARRSSDHG